MAAKTKELKMTEAEYWRWCYHQQIIETRKEKTKSLVFETDIKRLRALINNMGEKLLVGEIGHSKQKTKDAEKDLHSFRETISKRLKLDNFDEYIIDTDTYTLVHKSEVGN